MSQDDRQSPLKALLDIFGTCHKTHTMTTRFESHGTEDVPATQDSALLYLVPSEHTMLKGDNESCDKYSEETDTVLALGELLEHFLQLKYLFASLKSANHQPTPMAEMMQLTDKLQHLTVMIHLHPVTQPNEEPIHKTVQA